MRIPILFIGAALASIGCGAAPPPKTTSAANTPGESIAATPTIWVTPDLGSPHPGDPAPDFELVDQDGKTQKLSSYRGKVVVLTFMSGFCPFARAEQPNLKKLGEDYAGNKDVQVLDVLIKEEESEYATYMSRMPMPFPVMRDTTGQVGVSYSPPNAIPEVKGIPVVSTSNLIIDREGKIRFFTLVDIKRFDEKLVHLRRALDALIANKPG